MPITKQSVNKSIPRASTTMAPPGPGLPPWVPPKERERARREARPLPGDFGRSQIEAAAGRESWHADLGKQIEKAWAAVLKAISEAEEACTLYLTSDSEEAAERAEHDAKYAAWLDAGKPNGQSPGQYTLDWSSVKSQRLAVARRAIASGIETGKAYRATVTERAPADVDRLVDKSLKAREKAAEAIAVADEQVRAAVAAAKAARAADSALKITAGPGWWRSSAVGRGGVEDEALKGLRALQEWISSEDRLLTAEYLRDKSSSLPMETRRQIVEHGSDHHMTVLAAVEVLEDRRVTDLAGDFAVRLNEAWILEIRDAMARKDLTGIL